MVQMAICEIQYMKVRWLDHLKLWEQLPNSILSATSDTLPPTVINAAAASLNIYQCLHHFNRSQTDLELSSVHLFYQSSTSVKGGKSLESDFASTKVLPKCKKPPVSALICNLFARHRLASLFSLELPTWCLPSSRQWLPIARGGAAGVKIQLLTGGWTVMTYKGNNSPGRPLVSLVGRVATEPLYVAAFSYLLSLNHQRKLHRKNSEYPETPFCQDSPPLFQNLEIPSLTIGAVLAVGCCLNCLLIFDW